MNCPIPVVRKKINFGHIRPTSTMECLIFVSVLLANFGAVVVASGNGGILSASWKQLETILTVDATKLESSMANDSRGNGSFTPHEGEVEEKEVLRYHVAKFDFEYVSTNLMIAVWVLFASIAKIAFHSQKKLAKLFPESCLLIVIGVILGIILYFSPADDYNLDAQIFFLILLPPIILDAGYFMPSRSFFDNLGTILLYAVIETLLNTLFIGFTLWGVDRSGIFQLDLSLELLHCLVFASLLAAVDPVAVLAVFESIHINEILHIVVFGESLLNDGISVVLYHMFEGFSEIGMDNIIAVDVISGIASFFVIVFGATGIGILCGLLGGILSRFTRHVRVMEPLTVFVIGYLSFLLAEMFHLSGILSCTFCGITMKKYVEVNISQKSQTTIKYMLKMTASVCETIIFMYLGVSAVNKSHQWNTAFILLTLLFCLVYRTIGVIILTYFANRVRLVRLNKIDQFIMAYGGLRGAIAFALVVLLDAGIFPQRQLFVTTTVVVIYFTNLVMGSTIQPLVNFLKVKKNENQKPMMNEKINFRRQQGRSEDCLGKPEVSPPDGTFLQYSLGIHQQVWQIMDHIMAGIEDISGQKGHNLLRERFSHFNNKYLKPIIVGKHHPSQKRGYEIFNVYKRLSIKDAKGLAMNPSSPASLSMINSQIRRLSSLVEVSQANNWLSPSDEEAGHRSVIRPAALENHTASNGHAGPLGLNIDKPSAMSHNRTNHVNQCGPDQSREPRFSVALNSNRPLIYHRHMLNSTTSLAYPESNDSSWYTPPEDQDNNNNGRRHRKSVLFSIDLDQENHVPAEKDEDGAIYFGNAGQNNPSPDNFTVVDMERNDRGNKSSSQPTDWGIGSAVNSGFTNAAFISDNGNVPGHLRDTDNAVQIDHLSSSAPAKVLTNQRKSIGSKMADEKTCSASLSNKLGSEEMHLDKYPTTNSCCDSSAMLCENQLDCGNKALPDEKSDHSTYMNCYSSPGANFATSSNHSDGSRRPRNSKYPEKCDITEESKF